MPIQLGSEVHAVRENVVARTQDNGFHFFHPGQRLVVISLGCGLALCRPPDGPESTLYSFHLADLELW